MKNKRYFYKTGFKLSFSYFDIFKFKIRLFDYDDSHGLYYFYFWSFKIFWLEQTRMKYRKGKGPIKYSNTNWR